MWTGGESVVTSTTAVENRRRPKNILKGGAARIKSREDVGLGRRTT